MRNRNGRVRQIVDVVQVRFLKLSRMYLSGRTCRVIRRVEERGVVVVDDLDGDLRRDANRVSPGVAVYPLGRQVDHGMRTAVSAVWDISSCGPRRLRVTQRRLHELTKPVSLARRRGLNRRRRREVGG
jgi:hypothetical protein